MSLVTYNQQQAIKAISVNNASKYDSIATEVEAIELSDLLGVALLQDVQDNPLTTHNTELLDGATFEDCNGNIIKQKGLRYVLAYFNYAKYIGESFVNDTFTGFVVKNREESDIISEGTVKRLQLENRKIAMREWELVKAYLNENTANFPLWLCDTTKQVFNPKFTFIRNTVN